MTEDESKPDLGRTFCDVVMKGGITSGVVYPTAIAGLSKRYRLRNIGGASAGAIAAGAAAAAEYARQKHGTDAGFRRLASLAEELATPSGKDGEGPTLLFQLFAPTRLSRPLFGVLAGMLNRPTWKARVGFGLLSLVRAFPLTFALALVALAAVGAALWPGFRALFAGRDQPVAAALGLAAASALAALALIVAAAVAVLWSTIRRALQHLAVVMSRQDFGLCTGRRDPDDTAGPHALTDWLHLLIQQIANEPGKVLTFGDLRSLTFAETPNMDGVVLRMMTTCLTLGRPYTLPLQERLYFDPVELARYFPADVVKWMKEHAWRAQSKEEQDIDRLARERSVDGEARPLLPIPEPDDFPVLVGVRMSLSFPILLSAIPLHRVILRRDDGELVPERLLFTDGGVCSNLPIHLFDSPLPDWPTFALNLRDDLPAGSPDSDRVVPPRRGRSYQRDRQKISSDASLAAIGSYLGAIVNTMQNWRDMLQRAAPGARERVFTICHTAQEGGLNLDMDPDAIDAMARSGTLAADAIAEAFLAPPGTPPADDDWQHHRWVRLRLLLPVLREFLERLACGTQAGAPPIQSFLTVTPPLMRRSHELNQASRAAGWSLLQDLSTASQNAASQHPDFERTAPRPSGELRVTPTF
jgi:hypothetical protein